MENVTEITAGKCSDAAGVDGAPVVQPKQRTVDESVAGVRDVIQQKAKCGQCQYGKLLLWCRVDTSKPENWNKQELATLPMEEHRQDGKSFPFCFFCSNFRLPVPNPYSMGWCDGFKHKKGKPE